MQFIDAVNRVLRNNLILRGDDDNLVNFSDNTHEATSILAQQAIQSELNYLSSYELLPGERATGTITAGQSQRTYDLPTDFIEFYGTVPFLYDQANPTRYIYEYPGGFDNLRVTDRLWHQTEAEPYSFYFEDNAADQIQQIGLWQIPNADAAGNVYVFDYQKSVRLSLFDDLLPFHSLEAQDSFADMASRRFLFLMKESLDVGQLQKDFAWTEAKASLLRVLVRRKPRRKYGRNHNVSNISRI